MFQVIVIMINMRCTVNYKKMLMQSIKFAGTISVVNLINRTNLKF